MSTSLPCERYFSPANKKVCPAGTEMANTAPGKLSPLNRYSTHRPQCRLVWNLLTLTPLRKHNTGVTHIITIKRDSIHPCPQNIEFTIRKIWHIPYSIIRYESVTSIPPKIFHLLNPEQDFYHPLGSKNTTCVVTNHNMLPSLVCNP